MNWSTHTEDSHVDQGGNNESGPPDDSWNDYEPPSDVEEYDSESCCFSERVSIHEKSTSSQPIENDPDMKRISRLGDSFACKEFHPTECSFRTIHYPFKTPQEDLLDDRKPSHGPHVHEHVASTAFHSRNKSDETENIMNLLESGVMDSPMVGISQPDSSFEGTGVLSSFSSTFNCPSFSTSLNHLFDMPTKIRPTTEIKGESDSKVTSTANAITSSIQSPQTEQLVPDPIRNDRVFGWNYVPAMPINYAMPFIPMPMCSTRPLPNGKRKSEEASYPAAAFGLANGPAMYSNTLPVGCKCSKTRCLKLYCDCFQSNKTCGEMCSCVACLNTEEESGQSGERTKAIHTILMRRPTAFQKKTKTMASRCSCKNSR